MLTGDLTHAIESVTGVLQPQAERCGVRLRTTYPAGLRVSVDESALESALLATLRDSLAAAPRGSEVHVTADRETESCTVRFSMECLAPLATAELRRWEDLAERSGGHVRLRAGEPTFVVRLGRA